MAVLLGSVAPAARADDPVRIDDWRISRAMRVAERTWGGLPPDTNIVMVRRDEANRICEHDPGYDPIACAESPDLPSIPGRRIWWNLDAAASWPEADPAYICAVAVHEVGHLLGLGHVDDPHSIMYRGDPLPLPDGCTPTARRHTHRHRACAARRHRRPKCRVRRHVHRHVDWSVR